MSETAPNVTGQPAAEQPQADQPHLDENSVIRARKEKAQRLKDKGVDLYVHRFEPTHTVAQVRANEEALKQSQESVVMAGRVLLVRDMGKAGFFHFQDETGKFQAYVKKDVTAESGFDFFKHAIDIGDIVGIKGHIFVTKKGELTIQANELTLLTKSLRPLPEKWHGLTNVDQRYRQRYVDLIVNPEVRETFRTRSKIISTIRKSLDRRGYMEVETPMMQIIYGGASARPFTTHLNALELDLFLRIAPELFLKRLLVGGFDRVYEINRNFRNEGLSTRHNPEFTMLELYTAYWDYRDTMVLVEELFRETASEALGTTKATFQGKSVDFAEPFRRKPILSLVAEAVGLNPENHPLRWGLASIDEAIQLLGPGLDSAKYRSDAGHTLQQEMRSKDSADEALFHAFEILGEPQIVEPTFVIDFPKSLCPLAKSAAQDYATAERFELFCCGLELANAYSELNDPQEQLEKFSEQVARRKAGDMEAMSEVDLDYVTALEYGMPPASGLGIGIDRLVMLLTDSAAIRDVILFPLMRPLPRS